MKRTVAQLASFALMLLLLVNQLQATPSLPESKTSDAKIQMAILLDVSGSMNGLLEQAKSQIWRVVNELAKARYDGQQPQLEIALYSYGNNNNAPSGIAYLTRLSPLTTDLDRISEDLFALTTSGSAEFCGQVIQVSVKELEWSDNPDDLKLIFIAGNEPFDQGPVPYQDACKTAKGDNIIVNTIYCAELNDSGEIGWQEGARLTGGKFMQINHNEVTVHISSPYDDDLVQLNDRLNKTYVAYGKQGKKYQQRQLAQDANAAQYDKSNVGARGASKATAYYSNSHWDLVDASKDKDFKVTEIDRATLPEDMQKASDKELEKLIAEKKAERAQISKEILDLNAKRETYVAEKRAELGQENTLDQALINAVREQGESQQFLFEKF